MNTENELDNEIDELAVEIEQQIKEGKETIEEYEGVFDPKHRRMQEAEVEGVSLFS